MYGAKKDIAYLFKTNHGIKFYRNIIDNAPNIDDSAGMFLNSSALLVLQIIQKCECFHHILLYFVMLLTSKRGVEFFQCGKHTVMPIPTYGRWIDSRSIRKKIVTKKRKRPKKGRFLNFLKYFAYGALNFQISGWRYQFRYTYACVGLLYVSLILLFFSYTNLLSFRYINILMTMDMSVQCLEVVHKMYKVRGQFI